MDTCGISVRNTICRDTPGYNTAGSDNRVFTNGYVGQDGATRANGSTLLYECSLDMPIGIGLQVATGIGRTRIGVIDKGNIVSDEYVVFNGDSFTNEGMTGNLAAPSHAGVLLDFYKRADLGLVPHFAAIQIDEL